MLFFSVDWDGLACTYLPDTECLVLTVEPLDRPEEM